MVFPSETKPIVTAAPTPAAALRTLVSDNSFGFDRQTVGRTGIFVYASHIPAPPRLVDLEELATIVETEDRLAAVRSEMIAVSQSLEARLQEVRDQLRKIDNSLAENSTAIQDLQDFSADAARLGILQQARIDGLSEHTDLLSAQISRLRTGSMLQGDTLIKIQAELQRNLDAIQAQLSAIQGNLNRF